MQNCESYYLGLDIGTESVGYAVTGEDYAPLKHGGENMMGTHIFPKPGDSAARRSVRTARRRLDRRQQRVKLVQEIFAPEIAKVDENFFIRIKESALWREDRTNPKEANTYFTDKDFDDKAYYKKYPTIHHLICALMNDTEAHDVREKSFGFDTVPPARSVTIFFLEYGYSSSFGSFPPKSKALSSFSFALTPTRFFNMAAIFSG